MLGISIETTQNQTTEGLKNIFTEHELLLIECAFEKDTSFWNDRYDKYDEYYNETKAPKVFQQAKKFGEQHKKPVDRLLAIMQNIVDNNGVFKPNQEYEVVTI